MHLTGPQTTPTPLGTPGLPAGLSPNLPVPDQLVRARLGPYAGLYFALRAKHPPAAAHCLRVALRCSKWAVFRGLPQASRDVLEIAGLVHDVGKIGVADCILQKPGPLTSEECHAMELASYTGIDILSGVGAPALLLDTVQQSRFTFDSGHEQNPLARMLKIADAFDSMTTIQVFRQAISQERAIDTLFTHAGTQFDPELVKSFAELIDQPRSELEEQEIQHWLVQLLNNPDGTFVDLITPAGNAANAGNPIHGLFHTRLLESLNDAAIYLDHQGKILHWNRAAEQLSGRSPESVEHCLWTPKLLGLHDLDNQPIDDETCPLRKTLQTNTKHEVDLISIHTSGRKTSVVLTVIPVFTYKASFTGFVVLIRDDSLHTALEQKVRSLREIALQDPLTKVANRAELNNRLDEFVVEHLATGIPGAVIMCDIDYFKRINDTYSHHAGDEALITFANILRNSSRQNDLIARYGGEEFVILCDACDVNAAHSQAEKIRRTLEMTPIPSIKGQVMTASFGVTQLQAGDDAETAIARADRALMTAKGSGRNRVIQLGSGPIDLSISNQHSLSAKSDDLQRSTWLSWFTGQRRPVRQGEYLLAAPIEIALEKLQGFVRDHKAETLVSTPNHVSIRIKVMENARRRGEHPVPMIMDVNIQPVQFSTQGRQKVYQDRTKVTVGLFPVKNRDRRHSSLEGQAQQLLVSFQAYIVGQEIDDTLRKNIIEPR